MPRDDVADDGGRRDASLNVLGERLEVCSLSPMTGFFRDGCCDKGRPDIGSHTVCVVMTEGSSNCPDSAVMTCRLPFRSMVFRRAGSSRSETIPALVEP